MKEQERWAARTLLAALDPFFKAGGEFTARQIQAFLMVAAQEGLSVSEYAAQADESMSTMSRNLLDIGERNRSFERGAGLVDAVWDMRNAKRHTLTRAGWRLMSDVSGPLAKYIGDIRNREDEKVQGHSAYKRR